MRHRDVRIVTSDTLKTMVHQERVYLSPPVATKSDIEAVVGAMKGGWVAPTGPNLESFELAMAAYVGVAHAVGLSSGTAALHLGLKCLGVKPGDLVLVPTITFGATAFAVTYLGATPYFVDVHPVFGTMDPTLASVALEAASKDGQRISAAVPVDLYGVSADYSSLLEVFDAYDVPLLEDAAEGLGGTNGSKRLGSFGSAGVLSFNGNKILTTSGGGMFLTDNPEFASHVRKWASQSREPVPWYEHEEIGYNYRLSNLLAALGESQLNRIDSVVEHRRQVRTWYSDALSDVKCAEVLGDPSWGRSNAWLSIVRIHNAPPGLPERIRLALEEHNIESRPIWKPMHQQPVFSSAPKLLNGTADILFAQGLCLPSGPNMDEALVDRVVSIVIGEIG